MKLKSKLNLNNSPLKKTKTSRPKKWLLPFIIIIIILLAVLWLWRTCGSPNVDPNQFASGTVDKLLNATSLRYQTESLLTVNGQQICYGTINGEKADKNTYHAWGNILGSKVDVYQIGTTTYQLDEITGQWLVVPDNEAGKEAMLISEIDPASNFHFSDLGEAKLLDEEKINGQKCYKINLKPTLSDEWIEKYFTNINYVLWINNKGFLVKSVITGKTENNGTTGTLQISSSFKDYGKAITITPPIQSNNSNKNSGSSQGSNSVNNSNKAGNSNNPNNMDKGAGSGINNKST